MELVVYSSSRCLDCRTAKRFLDKHNIPYIAVDVGARADAAEKVSQHAGKRAIPQFVMMGSGCSLIVPAKDSCSRK